jgi:hypothetical protein
LVSWLTATGAKLKYDEDDDIGSMLGDILFREVREDEEEEFFSRTCKIPLEGEEDIRRRTILENGPRAREAVSGLFLPPYIVW